MALNNYYLTAAPSITSYDSFDFATRAGYKKFYACACADSASTKYFLTTQVLEGDVNTRSVVVNNTNTELNFDITFQNPIIVADGEALLNFSHTQAAGISTYVVITLYHVDLAATETSIGTIQTSTIASGGANWDTRRLAKVTLTKKSFGIGEKLRLSFHIYSSAVGDATFFFDPASRQTLTEDATGATIGTDLNLIIPFKIDL